LVQPQESTKAVRDTERQNLLQRTDLLIVLNMFDGTNRTALSDNSVIRRACIERSHLRAGDFSAGRPVSETLRVMRTAHRRTQIDRSSWELRNLLMAHPSGVAGCAID